MFKKLTDGCVHLVNRYLPDPFIFCIILTIVVFIGALPATHAGVIAVINAWGVGVWNLLAFSMQMVLVLVLGSAFANAPAIKKLIARIASIAKTPIQAIIVVTFFSLLACWLNWGFGLVVGAIQALWYGTPEFPDRSRLRWRLRTHREHRELWRRLPEGR